MECFSHDEMAFSTLQFWETNERTGGTGPEIQYIKIVFELIYNPNQNNTKDCTNNKMNIPIPITIALVHQ